MKQLYIKIGTVAMPLNDFVVSRNAILGITKSGKTFTAKGVAEQLMELGVPIIVFDAIGMWRFLKVPSGKHGGKGFPVVVAGGAQPDLPLNVHTAPQIVRAAIQQNISLVIDLYDPKLSKADWRRIVQDCFRILLFENKGLRHIFLEEAAEYVPQKVTDGQTYAEVEKLARMGGNASLGITFINPRAQELNKSVLELCDNIVLLRQRGTHAIDSLEKQMDKLSPDSAKEVALTMPNMTQGDCWVFTENGDKPVRTRSALIKSFHPDRRNPEANKVAGAAVNTDEFVSKLSGTLGKVIEEARANDPAELKRQIIELKTTIAGRDRELKKLEISTAMTAKLSSRPDPKPVAALTDFERKRLTGLCEKIDIYSDAINRANSQLGKLQNEKDGLVSEAVELRKIISGKLAPARSIPMPEHRQAPTILRDYGFTDYRAPVRDVDAGTNQPGNVSLGKCERGILTALAQYPAGRTAVQVALLSEYSVNSGGFNNALGKLRSLGFITRNQPICITEAGLETLGDFTPLPTGIELAQHWINKLGKCEAAILQFLVDNHPETFMSAQVGEAVGYSANSGGFNNALGRLRTLELITRGQPMQATDEFFQ